MSESIDREIKQLEQALQDFKHHYLANEIEDASYAMEVVANSAESIFDELREIIENGGAS